MLPDAGAARLAAAAVLVLLAAVLARHHARDPSARASLALIAAVLGHLAHPWLSAAGAPRPLVLATLLLGLSAPFAFWLLAQVHFEDEFRLRGVHAALLAVPVGVGYVSWRAVVDRSLEGAPFGPEHRALWALAPRLLALALVAHALLRVHAGARHDLLAARLRARTIVLVMAGTYMLMEILGEALLSGSPAAPLAERFHLAAVLVLATAVTVAAVRVDPEVLRPARAAAVPPADPVLADRLRRLLEVEEVFREEGLTLPALAAKLGAPDHKVRRLVNAQLGFRNFNALLNDYRIRAARRALADPASGHLGVAEIAFRVGYRSLATFNKAFKERTGRTPTEYRAAPDEPAAARDRPVTPDHAA